jgi:preprotein translocase subunit SecF
LCSTVSAKPCAGRRATDLRDVINDAVNQTLSRTTMTAGTTLLALLPLVFMGGPTLINFSAALTWGILVGTYSSIDLCRRGAADLHAAVEEDRDDEKNTF